MTIQEKFQRLGIDNAPGQESLQKAKVLDLRGEKLEGPAVDFSHGDVDAHQPTPGSFEVFAAGVEEGAAQAYTPYRGRKTILEDVAESLSRFAGVSIDPATQLILTPGTQGALFLAMGTGLIAGMGYLGFAALFTLVMCAAFLGYHCLNFGQRKNACCYKTLTVMIPEDLDYSSVFDDILDEYASAYELVRVKTTNMGSLFRLTYEITLRDPGQEKQMIDRLRCRNGNLEISVSRQETVGQEL